MPTIEPRDSEAAPAETLVAARAPVQVVLDNIRSAYNVGSMFRTGDACAIARVHLCGMSAHPPHKKLEKTALGAEDHVPWTYWERTRDCLAELDAAGLAVVGIECAPRAFPMDRYVWPRPLALVFGNEVDGINERRLAQCQAVVQIPMRGHKNSLNVATAFGVVLYDVLRQWDAW